MLIDAIGRDRERKKQRRRASNLTGINQAWRDRALSHSGFKEGKLPVKYLGLPFQSDCCIMCNGGPERKC
ncbi:unnamed protein product [Linum trigynum]|uniref:Uncharacterized protein n=1 Tax=Linum trigynum TaxID=586398 RepID=A0AAV2E9S2_9ROSI